MISKNLSRLTIVVLTVSALFLAGFVPCFSQERSFKIRIGIINLKAREGYTQSEADQITDLLRNELINSAEFDVIDAAGLPEELQKIAVSCTEKECALVLGKAMKTDYVLVGSLGTVSGKVSLTVLMMNVLSDKPALGDDVNVPKDKLLAELKTLSVKISNAAFRMTNVTLDDIREYIKRENYSNARRFLDYYLDREGKGGKDTEDLSRIINEELAKAVFSESKRLLALYLFDDARQLLGEALTYSPDSLVYKDFAASIDVEEKRQKNMSGEQRLAEIARLVKEENYEAGQTLLAVYDKTGEDTVTARELKETVRIGLEAEGLYRDAERSFALRNFSDARISLDAAKALNPAKPEYLALFAKVEAAEKKDRVSRQKWQDYVTEIKTIDTHGLFLVKKPISRFEHIGVRWEGFSCRDTLSLETYKDTLTGLDISFMSHVLKPFAIPLSFMDVYVTVFGRGGFALSNNESVGAGISTLPGVRTLETSSNLNIDISGGAGMSLQLFSYILGVGFEVNTGIFNMSAGKKIPSLVLERESSVTFYSLGLGIDSWLAWTPSEKTEILFNLRFAFPWFLGPEHTMEKRRTTGFTISLGNRLF